MALQITVETTSPFRRGDLLCRKLLEAPAPDDGCAVLRFIAGAELGSIVLAVRRLNLTGWPRFCEPGIGEVKINGELWGTRDLSAHSPQPLACHHPGEPPTIGQCEFLDGMACWTEASGMAAIEIMQHVSDRGSEELIWPLLAASYHVMLVGRQAPPAQPAEARR